MECKFITNGIALDYSGIVKPCCVFKPDLEYQSNNHIQQVDLVTWHQKPMLQTMRKQLSQGEFPDGCWVCKQVESQDRGDSMRLNGKSAYSEYDSQDITLELRPGNVCNFACQTCWPQASTRVANYYNQAGIEFVDAKTSSWDYQQIEPIKHRIKNIVVLGGEPFYDKQCVAFLKWLKEANITCPITIFTNGSTVNRELLSSLTNQVTLVFSMDAIGTPAEYIRIGTDWNTVLDNYNFCKTLPNVDVRVNITTSPYNYLYLDQLIDWLSSDWPSLVTFGVASSSPNVKYMDESVFPVEKRAVIIERIEHSIQQLRNANIKAMQKVNALNALYSIKNNLQTMPYNSEKHSTLLKFINQMDRVKHIDVRNYCPDLVECLCINETKFENDSPEFLSSLK